MQIDNEEATKTRLQVADKCLDDLIDWLQTGGGQVAIFDGNNVTESRRKQIHDKLLAYDIHVSIRICVAHVIDCYSY